MASKPVHPGIFSQVERQDGSIKKVRVLEGQIFVCEGCCCGNLTRGHSAVPVEAFKSQWKENGMRLRLHLTFTACLGPCAAANVVLLLFAGESVWLHSIDTPNEVELIFDYLGDLLRTGVFSLPAGRLAKYVFSRYMSAGEVQDCAEHGYPSELVRTSR